MLLNLEESQHKGTKAKAGKIVGFFYQQYCCDTAPGVGMYRAGSCSEGCSLMERCFVCLLWHLQYFPYRGFPLSEAAFHPKEVSSPTMAASSRAQQTNRSVFSILSPTRVAAGIHSSCRDQRLGEQSLHCPAASTIKGKKDFNSGDRERKGGGWRRWGERSWCPGRDARVAGGCMNSPGFGFEWEEAPSSPDT